MWLGWFGPNGGATIASGQVIAVAFTNRQLAACAGVLSWMFALYVFTESPDILSLCSGLVCGLASITSEASYASHWAVLVIAAIGGVLTYIYSHHKTLHFKENRDCLDIYACHGIGGARGGIATGLFAITEYGLTF